MQNERKKNKEIDLKCSRSDDNYDPDPLTIILEIANLVIQPGSLSLLASSVSAVTGVLMWQDVKNRQVTEIRRKLFEIDRALTDGFAALMVLGSLLDQFNHLEKNIYVGGAPIKGFKNAKRLRKAHEDCRIAVKDTRDAFSDLSALLPQQESRNDIIKAIEQLNKLSAIIISIGQPYARFLVAASQALSVVDNLICQIGKHCDFKRQARSFTDDLIKSQPSLRHHIQDTTKKAESSTIGDLLKASEEKKL